MAISAFSKGLVCGAINSGTNPFTSGSLTSSNSLNYTFITNFGSGFGSKNQADSLFTVTLPTSPPYSVLAFVTCDTANGPHGMVLFSTPAANIYFANILWQTGGYLSLSNTVSKSTSTLNSNTVYNGYTGVGGTVNAIWSIMRIS